MKIKLYFLLAFCSLLALGLWWQNHLNEELCRNRPPNFETICLVKFTKGDTGWEEYKQWCEGLHGTAESFEEQWYGKFSVPTYACHELGKK
jgi:hypothetical protein